MTRIETSSGTMVRSREFLLEPGLTTYNNWEISWQRLWSQQAYATRTWTPGTQKHCGLAPYTPGPAGTELVFIGGCGCAWYYWKLSLGIFPYGHKVRHSKTPATVNLLVFFCEGCALPPQLVKATPAELGTGRWRWIVSGTSKGKGKAGRENDGGEESVTEAKGVALASARGFFGQPILDKTYFQVGLDGIGKWEMHLKASLGYIVKFYCKN